MRRITMTLTDDLEAAITGYQSDQQVPPSLNAIVQVALRDFLQRQGYLREHRHLAITPAVPGSGFTDTSINHDQVLASITEQ